MKAALVFRKETPFPKTSRRTENAMRNALLNVTAENGLANAPAQITIRLDLLQLAPFEYDHLFYEPRGPHGERLAVGRYLISDQGDVLVPFLSDECKNM